ncbi:S24/S26 family peptidase [Cardiobacteriaceae bacterium TAE3-ERU3]|nr:S24/S26 family peptidase [Cardiobacteriaceae bacterium TAE3-ERU3]
MSPDFLPGDFVIAYRHPWQHLNIGDDVVINHAIYGITIKRICAIQEQGYSLTGLHPDSVTPREIGIQPKEAILGKVLYHVRQPRQS